MFGRRLRYKLTFLHISAPAIIWTYVYAYASVAGELDNADVAVANVSYAFRKVPLPNTFRSTVFVVPERSQAPDVLRLSSGVRSGAQTIVFVVPENQKRSNR